MVNQPVSPRRRRSHRAGFTLIEVLLVLVILVILGTLAVGMFTRTQETANVKAAKSQIGLFKTPLDTYHLDVKRYPSRLEDLITRPADISNPNKWNGPYLDSTTVPLDPWGQPYQYDPQGTRNPNRPDIWSLGPDGVDNTADDIGNWE